MKDLNAMIRAVGPIKVREVGATYGRFHQHGSVSVTAVFEVERVKLDALCTLIDALGAPSAPPKKRGGKRASR